MYDFDDPDPSDFQDAQDYDEMRGTTLFAYGLDPITQGAEATTRLHDAHKAMEAVLSRFNAMRLFSGGWLIVFSEGDFARLVVKLRDVVADFKEDVRIVFAASHPEPNFNFESNAFDPVNEKHIRWFKPKAH